MNSDYFDLKNLQASPGYQKLQALWVHKYALMMEKIKQAGARGNESAWRYFAGQLKGADDMTGLLDKALLEMEQAGAADDPNPGTSDIEELMKEARGEKQ